MFNMISGIQMGEEEKGGGRYIRSVHFRLDKRVFHKLVPVPKNRGIFQNILHFADISLQRI
jgi:hypothetical protein